MITELAMENFRGFVSLELKDLKRVNIVVGQNNSGKTSLLEGILLLCEPARVSELPRLFRAAQGNADVRYFRWLLRDQAPGSKGELRCKLGSVQNALLLTGPGFRDQNLSQYIRSRQIYGLVNLKVSLSEGSKEVPCRITSIQQRDPNTLVSLVGKAQRKAEGEETLQRLLASMDPRIKKVRVDPGEDGNQVIVDIGLSELLPVSQVGQGVYRLMAIMAEIIGETPEVVLIDEIENGLHHSVQEIVWKGLAETAERLNVQIFATTHSDECFKSAHRAFLNRKNYDFGVIQLFRVESGVQGRVLDRKHIEAAIAGEIDLR